MAQDWNAERLAALISARSLGQGPWAFKPLHGGYWNQVVMAQSTERRLVLKIYGTVLADSLFPNLPEAEAAALQRLAGHGVAPEPVAYWPDLRILAYEYVEGEPWQADTIAVATLLRRKEGVSAAGFRAVPVLPEAILDQGDALFARCAPDEIVSAYRKRRPQGVALAPPARFSLIHTDIGATNLIGGGEALRLIDWQCPAAGDLAEDIYSFLSPAFQILNLRQPLAAAERATFFAALDLPEAQERHARLEPFFAYRMAGYCCLRRQTADDAAVRERYRLAALAELKVLAP